MATGLPPSSVDGVLFGLWVEDDGRVQRWVGTADGGRRLEEGRLRPFCWLVAADATGRSGEGVEVEETRGPGELRYLAHFPTWKAARARLGAAEADGPPTAENQWLIQAGERYFGAAPFGALRRCQLDIETGTGEAGEFSSAERGDRVLAVGLRCGGEDVLLELEDDTDEAERGLLGRLAAELARLDPDTLEGHNLFRFDLDYLRRRSRHLGLPCRWGRGGREVVWRPRARLRLAERQIDYPRCDVPGRAVVDTYFLVLLYDLARREMESHSLKEAAIHLGVTDAEEEDRTYIEGSRIHEVFRSDRARFRAYLRDDLRETQGLADLLLPTYVAQARTFPLGLQDAILRGQAGKVDLLFFEDYYRGRGALARPPEARSFEGGFTRSYREGVFRRVFHYDVASLYPSLLLLIGRPPAGDHLGVFLPLLRRLRTERLGYKRLARTAPTAEERAESDARQAAYKILINSFYGYLGFGQARFGDADLAAEVTARGRELLQALIARLGELGATVLEADTDGLYVAPPDPADDPEELLARLRAGLPEGIELEYDGCYDAMFSYKAKNYALRDGERVVVRGSALRSRGTEPFLRRLTRHLVRHLLGLDPESPLAGIERLRAQLRRQELPVRDVARVETLSASPAAYRAEMEAGGKPRRAALEAAGLLEPAPRLGDRVRFYLVPGPRRTTPDWQRARPVEQYDAVARPYDAEHYNRRLDDWLQRYGPFLGAGAGAGAGGGRGADDGQGELAME